jgi:phytoene dehydrogenase-like protein
VQYGPYNLKEGTWPEIREKVGDVVIDTVAEYAPNIKSAIIARDVVTPWDLEQEYGLTQGNIFQGSMGSPRGTSSRGRSPPISSSACGRPWAMPTTGLR